MASLYSVIPGLVPSTQEVIEAELLAKQILEGEFPDMDLREGTGLRDLVLRPTAYAFAMLRKASDYYFTQNTLRGVNDSTPTDTVDDILSNWFMTRNTGTYAVISARLYFARQKNITITTDISFSPDNTLQFYPEESKVYNSSALSYDSYSNEWYLDVFLRASDTGTDYNLSEGSLLYFTSFDPYFLRAEINYLAQESTPAETNTQFISRAANSISTRNLVNSPSVDSKIRELFNYVSKVVTVGSGDPDMIRDMIRVMFDPPKQYNPTGASINGNSITFNIGANTFAKGQGIDLANGIPSVFNGRFTIQSIGTGTITVDIPSNPGFITQIPTITLAMEPLYIHDGGKVDVFCCDKLATEVTQLTLDAFGTAQVQGAVYALERSQVSGGTTNDTIPYQRTATASAYTVDYVAKTAAVTSAGHDIVAGSAVVTGISQAATISAISCLGLTVTVTATGHGVAIGDNVTIQGVSPTAYNGTYVVTNVSGNTFQYIVPAQIASSGSGATMKAYNAMLETSNVVSSVASGTFTVSLPKLWTDSVNAPVTGTMVVSQSIDYTVSNPNVRPIVTQSFEIDNGIADVLMYNHGYTQGRYITIKNCTNPAVNGSWRITNVISGSEFQFEVPALVNTATTTVTGDFEYVSHQYDYGFSSKQVLEVSFGSSFANQTASFLLYYFRDADGIQTFLDSPDNKVLCGDYLARGFNLHLLDVSVTSYNGPAASSTTIQSAVEGYLSSMSPGDTLVLSDLIQALGTAGISNIKTPVDVKYTRYTRDLTPAVSGTVVDYLDPQDKTNVFLLRSVSTSTENV